MKNPRLAQIFQGREQKYPHALEEQFERILERIAHLWDYPSAGEYFQELLLDQRGDRHGFPANVAHELWTLQGIWEAEQRGKNAGRVPPPDPWAHIKPKEQLEELGFAHTPRGLARAVESGAEQAVELFIKSRINLDTPNDMGWTPLMIAAFHGHEKIALMLIDSGANVHASDERRYTPMHWAAFQGFELVVMRLIGKGAAPDVANSFGWTPMMQAATRGHFEIVRILLDHGAYADQCAKDGWAALHKATANGHLDVIQLLLDRGAYVNPRYQDGSTPLKLARQKGRREIAELLASRGGKE